MGGGNEQKYGVMFNVLYDFVGFVPMVTPYVGTGVGYQWVNDRSFHLRSQGALSQVPNSTEGKFANQGIVGAALPIAGVPGLSATLDYRFMQVVGDRTVPARCSTWASRRRRRSRSRTTTTTR